MMSLKQKLAISLCAFYMISVIGFALSFHFCGGKLASVAVYNSKSACKYCKTEPVDKKDDGCCQNTKVDLKVKDSHQTESSFKLAKLFNIDALLHPNIQQLFKSVFPELISQLAYKDPPKPTGTAIRVLNCVFRN